MDNLEKSLERSLADLAAAVVRKAPPASRQLQDPTRARTGGGVTASKTMQYGKDGRLTGYLETKADGERVEQVFERDASGRISKITAVPAGATAPGRPIHPRGGFVNAAPAEPEYTRAMKAMHAEAWIEFVQKHGVEKIAKSAR